MSGKLHLPGPGLTPTACGRNLNNNRAGRSQTASNVIIAANLAEYMTALHDRKACRHCGREAGIIARVTRVSRDDQDEGDESDE